MYPALLYRTASLLPPLYGSYALTTQRTPLLLQSCAYGLPTTNCKGSPWVIIASSPAFCSPLKGVLAGAVGLPQTFASSSGELNQKPTLKVWIGLNRSAGFSIKVSLSKMPRTVTSALPPELLWMSD